MAVLDELATVAGSACASASAVRARQVAMVTGELGRYLHHRDRADPAPSTLAELLGPTHLNAYLALADTGALALRPRRPGATASAATARVRHSVLNALAAVAALPRPCPHLPEPGPAPPLPEPGPTNIVLDYLRGRAAPAAAPALAVRAALVASLVAEHGLRPGELAAARVTDLDLPAHGHPNLTYTPAPPASRGPRDPLQVPLSASTAAVAAHWLALRADLAAPRVTHLLVSVAGNHDGAGSPRRYGMPLHATGIRRAHSAALRQANRALAGSPGYDGIAPAPGRLRHARHRPPRPAP